MNGTDNTVAKYRIELRIGESFFKILSRHRLSPSLLFSSTLDDASVGSWEESHHAICHSPSVKLRTQRRVPVHPY